MPLYALNERRPVVPASAWIAPSADVIGEAILGEGVGIWFGAVLRGDNEPIVVGARSNIQEGAVVHVDPGFPTTIGEGCNHQRIGLRNLLALTNALVL